MHALVATGIVEVTNTKHYCIVDTVEQMHQQREHPLALGPQQQEARVSCHLVKAIR
jgi:hypothetical protein